MNGPSASPTYPDLIGLFACSRSRSREVNRKARANPRGLVSAKRWVSAQ
jgi:hypothetical protein